MKLVILGMPREHAWIGKYMYEQKCVTTENLKDLNISNIFFSIYDWQDKCTVFSIVQQKKISNL